MPRRVLDLLNSWDNSLGHGQVHQIWKQVPLCVMWGIWRERNARHFEDVEMLVLELCRNVLNMLFVWVSAHTLDHVTFVEFLISYSFILLLGALLYIFCVLGLRPYALFNDMTLFIKKEKISHTLLLSLILYDKIDTWH